MSKLKEIQFQYLGTKEEMRKYLLSILIGNLFCAVAMSFFFKEKHLLSGGIGGISLMIHYLTKLPIALFTFSLNIPLVIFGYANLSKKFTTYGMISPLVLSLYLYLLDFIENPFLLNDQVLVALTGGVLNGIGMGIMFRNGTCQGGIDILAAIFKKKAEMNIGNALLAMNSLIIIVASYLFGLDKGLYTIMAMVVGYRILDRIELKLGETKQVLIITSQPQELSNAILNKIHRGVTILHGEGAFTKKEQKVLLCVLYTRQIPRLKALMRTIDQKAFMSVVDAHEVQGRGFEHIEL